MGVFSLNYSIFVVMNATITLQNLSIGYRAKGKTHRVAKGICASLYSGEVTCLLGPNGVGKSTLLKTLSTFLPPLSGEIRLNERPLSSYTHKEIAHFIGVVLTEKPEAENLTAEQLVGLGRSPYTGFWGTLSQEDKDIVSEAMQQVGISHLRGRNIQKLSDGERQKVVVAKALAQQTPVIFLDESTAFLDYPSKVETLLLLRQLAHELNKTIMLSTHDVELAMQYADKLWLMTRGEDAEVTFTIGTPQELTKQGVVDLLSRNVMR